MKDLGKYRRSESDFLEVFEATRTFELTFLATWLVPPFSKAPSQIFSFSPKSVTSRAYKNYNNIFILTLFIINIIIIYRRLVRCAGLNWVVLDQIR